MRRRVPRDPVRYDESYFDLIDDFELIESSFMKQYGVRIRCDDDMSWPEFCSLLSGIMHDTPLGHVVSIRAEKNYDVIKDFTPEEKKIRNDWILKRNKELRKNKAAYAAYVENFQNSLKAAFSN